MVATNIDHKKTARPMSRTPSASKAIPKAKPKLQSKAKSKAKAKAKEKAKPIEVHKYDVFATNFNAALDASGYPQLHFGRQVEVGKTFGISTSAARKWVMGDCLPDHNNLIMIADTLKVSLDTLFGRSPRLGSEPMVSIPIGGPKNGEGEWLEKFSAIQMEATWLETGMRMQHNDLFLLMVSGDNMSPTLADGDIVFVDATPIKDIQNVEENGIYLIMVHGRTQIRRILLGLDNTITLTSDNKHFPPVTVPVGSFSPTKDKKQPPAMKLIGRIPWTIHRVGRVSKSPF